MFNYTAASKIEDLREADIGARSRSRSPGHSHNVLDSAKSSCGGLILGPVSISKGTVKSKKAAGKELNRQQEQPGPNAQPSREDFDFEKGNLVGQRIALQQKVKTLEAQLDQQEQILNKRTASLQIAVQEYRQLSGRLNKCKAEKDAATLRSQQLHISLVKLEEETRQKELAAAEELPGDYDAKHPEEQEAAYSQRLKREVRSECQAIAALSSLACKAQRRILELERRVFAMAGRFEMEPDTTCELQAAIFKALKKQLKKKDMEVGQLKAALKDAKAESGQPKSTVTAEKDLGSQKNVLGQLLAEKG